MTGSARAETGGCFLEVRGRVMLDGACQTDLRRDGGFTFDMVDPTGAEVNVSVFAEGRGTATGLLNVVAGQINSYQDLGRLSREGRCWARPNVRTCSWPSGEAKPGR